MKFFKVFAFSLLIPFLLISCSHQRIKISNKNRVPLSIENKDSKNDPDLKQNIIKQLDLQMGLYISEGDESESCYEGDLEVINIDDTVSILIGSRLLVAGLTLDRNVENFSERGCSNEIIISLSNDKVITTQHEKKCKKSKTISLKRIEFTRNKISYTVNTTENGKSVFAIRCQLIKKSI